MYATLKNTINAVRYLFTNEIDPDGLYRLIDSLTVDKNTGFPLVNMGYWEGTEMDSIRYESLLPATNALFKLVADGAQISDNDEIIADIGCGFSTNMIYCAQHYNAKRWIGLNLANEQIEYGRLLIERNQLASKIEVQHGSATEMPFADASIDKMVTVEAAFHFRMRDDFFKEAYRCLKPNGILSLADLVIKPAQSVWEKAKLTSVKKGLHVPSENIYDIPTYVEKLKDAGFEVILQRAITQNVVPQFYKWFWQKPIAEYLKYNVVFSITSLGFLLYPLEYVQIVAKKP